MYYNVQLSRRKGEGGENQISQFFSAPSPGIIV